MKTPREIRRQNFAARHAPCKLRNDGLQIFAMVEEKPQIRGHEHDARDAVVRQNSDKPFEVSDGFVRNNNNRHAVKGRPKYFPGDVRFLVGSGGSPGASLDHAVFLITFDESSRASRMSMNLGSSR